APVTFAPDQDPDGDPTTDAPHLERWSREWYVALALAEPWLTGSDDYPRPPSNREIYERVLAWRGHAWNLERAQRVDDAIRSIARLAFGPTDDPFTVTEGRVQNVRFAVGRRAAEAALVTTADLEAVLDAQARGAGPNPEAPTDRAFATPGTGSAPPRQPGTFHPPHGGGRRCLLPSVQAIAQRHPPRRKSDGTELRPQHVLWARHHRDPHPGPADGRQRREPGRPGQRHQRTHGVGAL